MKAGPVGLPNDFDNSRRPSRTLLLLKKFAIKNERPRWNTKDHPCPHSKTSGTKPLHAQSSLACSSQTPIQHTAMLMSL
jgi:hypothetical protein